MPPTTPACFVGHFWMQVHDQNCGQRVATSLHKGVELTCCTASCDRIAFIHSAGIVQSFALRTDLHPPSIEGFRRAYKDQKQPFNEAATSRQTNLTLLENASALIIFLAAMLARFAFWASQRPSQHRMLDWHQSNQCLRHKP